MPGTPRALSLDEAVELRRVARALARPTAAGRAIVAITADAGRRADRARSSPPSTPTRSSCPATSRRRRSPPSAGRPGRRSTCRADEPDDVAAAAAPIVALGREFLAAGAERILLDTAGGPHPGGTGTRAAPSLAAAVAREMPVILAGGLDPATVGRGAPRDVPAVGVDVASGRRAAARSTASARRRTRSRSRCSSSGPARPASTGRTSPSARRRSIRACSRPTTPAAGAIDREFGGRYVPETLMAALHQLEDAYAALRHDPRFWSELRELLARYAGRPTALYRADRLAYEALERAIAARRARRACRTGSGST